MSTISGNTVSAREKMSMTIVTAEMPERGETDEQTASILKLAEAVVRDIEEHRDEDLDKLVAKLPDALVWLAHAPTTVPSETLPNHEIRA